MGRASRFHSHSPARLAEKLRQIRASLDLSQSGLYAALGSPEKLERSSISAYERGVREPPLLILLAYARLAGVSTDVLIDDHLDLPKSLTKNTRARAGGGRKSI